MRDNTLARRVIRQAGEELAPRVSPKAGARLRGDGGARGSPVEACAGRMSCCLLSRARSAGKSRLRSGSERWLSLWKLRIDLPAIGTGGSCFVYGRAVRYSMW